MRRRTLKLVHRLSFQEKGSDRWEERFQKRGDFLYLRGAETVIAGRMAGTNIVVVTVRYTKNLDAVVGTWRIKDSKGRVFNIKSLHRTEDQRFFELTCETGSPS